MTHVRPDRSGYSPNFAKSDENPSIDIGWAEGALSDGRPFRAECWAQDQSTFLTFYFSRRGYENATNEAIACLLEGEGLLRFAGEAHPVSAQPFRDAVGHDLLMATVVVGTEEAIFVQDSLSLLPYEGQGITKR